MESRKKRNRKKMPLEVRLELFRSEIDKKPQLSLHEINILYRLPNQSLYEEILALIVELAFSLDADRLKTLIADAEKLGYSTMVVFQDSFARIRLRFDTIPLPHQVQWLANWAAYLLFNEDQSPRYEPESESFEQLLAYLKQNFDNEKLMLSLRLRFGLLIAYLYIIPAMQHVNNNDFEINPRPTRSSFRFSPKDVDIHRGSFNLDAYLFWLNEITALKGEHKLDTLNLRADCKELIYKFKIHFFPQIFYGFMGKVSCAFFSAAHKYQSIIHPTAPNEELDLKMGNSSKSVTRHRLS